MNNITHKSIRLVQKLFSNEDKNKLADFTNQGEI